MYIQFLFCHFPVFSDLFPFPLSGMSIYFFYGIHHSVEGERQKEQGNYIPLEQVDGDDRKDDHADPPQIIDDPTDPPQIVDDAGKGEEKEDEKKDEKFTAPS